MLLWEWLLWAWRGATRTPKRREAPPRPSVRPSPPEGATGGAKRRTGPKGPPARRADEVAEGRRKSWAAVSNAAGHKIAGHKTAAGDAAVVQTAVEEAAGFSRCQPRDVLYILTDIKTT